MARIGGRQIPILVKVRGGFRPATLAEARRAGAGRFCHAPIYERNPGRWVTLRSGHRAEIEDGKILRGVPSPAVGMPLRELGAYWRDRREVMGVPCGSSRRASTYATKAEALRALLDVNPELDSFLERQSGRMSGDQALEPVRERLGKSIRSWNDAVLAVIPGSRAGKRARWDQVGRNLWILEEALGSSPAWSGRRLAPPAEAIDFEGDAETVRRCESGKLDVIDDIGVRYAGGARGEDTPF